MIPRLGWSAPALLLLSALSLAPRADSEDAPPTTLPAQPIRASIDRVVEKMERDRNEPCHKAADAGVPCYPTSTAANGPVYSVRDSLGVGPEASRSPIVPGGITLDPVCLAKSAVKALKGKNDVYYLYRVRLPQGEHVEMREQRLDPTAYQGNVEFLGRVSGECEALAAYRKEERQTPPAGNKAETAGPPAR
jgi:hypothetical protein